MQVPYLNLEPAENDWQCYLLNNLFEFIDIQGLKIQYELQ